MSCLLIGRKTAQSHMELFGLTLKLLNEEHSMVVHSVDARCAKIP